MGEAKKPSARLSLGLTGLEKPSHKEKHFSYGDTIFILESDLTAATVNSEKGFTASRLNEKKGRLHKYELKDEKASINITKYGAGGNMEINKGFLFWGH